LASSVEINKLIHLSGTADSIATTTISLKNFEDPASEMYINRWMDITKSTMLFSRGIILVEGIAEALIIPKIAEVVLKKYNQAMQDAIHLASTLDEMGVSVININGINFKYFMKLFGNFDKSEGPNIPIFCAGVTDNDPGAEIYPLKDERTASKNPIVALKEAIDANERTRLFVSPLKTFEYDLATYNPALLASVLKSLWPTQDGTVSSALQAIADRNNEYANNSQLRDDAKYIYMHIDSNSVGKGIFAHILTNNIDEDFIVPDYISNAILWACGGLSL